MGIRLVSVIVFCLLSWAVPVYGSSVSGVETEYEGVEDSFSDDLDDESFDDYGFDDYGQNGFADRSCGQACVYSFFELQGGEQRFGVGINVPLGNPHNVLVNARAKKVGNDDARLYIRAIAEACRTEDYLGAELNAKGLGQLWNVDYRDLLSPSCTPPSP